LSRLSVSEGSAGACWLWLVWVSSKSERLGPLSFFGLLLSGDDVLRFFRLDA
jgi:hypothetical protein